MVADGAVPSEANLDTGTISGAFASASCVKLVVSGAKNAFVIDGLSIPSNKTLWVDAGVTVYGKILTSSTLITIGSGGALMGAGTIDAQGGEPSASGGSSAWKQSSDLRASNGSASLPSMIQWSGSNVTLYKITLHNGQKFQVIPNGSNYLIWGITIKTPSRTTNSRGDAVSPFFARNTDAIDPGQGGSGGSNGFIVYSNISTGDDHIAIKGSGGVSNIKVLHNHFGSGHGMSIGSETQGGVSGIDVCDLTVDGSLRPTGGSPPIDVNGLRIKSDSSRGGKVSNITYDQVCVRDVDFPIVFNPNYSTKTGSSIPNYTGLSVTNLHATSSSIAQTVVLDGFNAANTTFVKLNNVVVDATGAGSAHVTSQFANVTLGPGNVSPLPTASSTVAVTNNISGTSTPIDCSARWFTF